MTTNSFAEQFGFGKAVRPLVAGFTEPSPIQAACWPLLKRPSKKLENGKKEDKKRSKFGHDVVGIAETGSGKTLAFAMPLLDALCRKLDKSQKKSSEKKEKKEIKTLVVTPTRELALQICKVIGAVHHPNVQVVSVVGGEDRAKQIRQLAASNSAMTYQVVVGTPGRLKDLLDAKALQLQHVSHFVLDEADRMLDAGFEPELRALAAALPVHRQTVMFSATWPPTIQQLASRYMRPDFKVVDLRNQQKDDTEGLRANTRIDQVVKVVRDPRDKEQALVEAMRPVLHQKTIVFVLYKREAPQVAACIKRVFPPTKAHVHCLHGDMAQSERNLAVSQFSADPRGILVATDVAARGLDIADVAVVINYTFPLTIEDYVHRIGRTARAGKTGVAITLFSDHDKQHAGSLVGVLQSSGQPVPDDLVATYGCTTKKRVHKDFGAFYRPELANLKSTHTKFASDDE